MESSKGLTESNEQKSGHFREKGVFDNEVILLFDNGEELYVPTDFLKLASPVFKTMLEADFKEKHSGVIELKGKDPTDVMELLNSIHPAVLKKISEETVFKMTPLAEEYAILPIIKRCKDKMTSMMVKLKNTEKYRKKKRGVYEYDNTIENTHCDNLCQCIHILNIASTYSYDELKHYALNVISEFGSVAYLGEKKESNKRCVEEYDSLDETAQNDILRKRLKHCDDTYVLGS